MPVISPSCPKSHWHSHKHCTDICFHLFPKTRAGRVTGSANDCTPPSPPTLGQLLKGKEGASSAVPQKAGARCSRRDDSSRPLHQAHLQPPFPCARSGTAHSGGPWQVAGLVGPAPQPHLKAQPAMVLSQGLRAWPPLCSPGGRPHPELLSCS